MKYLKYIHQNLANWITWGVMAIFIIAGIYVYAAAFLKLLG